jgi:hypothetical protein
VLICHSHDVLGFCASACFDMLIAAGLLHKVLGLEHRQALEHADSAPMIAALQDCSEMDKHLPRP